MSITRVLTLVLMTAFLLLPGYAGGGGGGGGGSSSGGGGQSGIGVVGGPGSRPGSTGGGGPFDYSYGRAPSGVAQEVFNDYHNSSVNLAAGTLQEVLFGDSFTTQMTGGAANRMDVRLPGYSYFQGLVHADNHVTVAGQVRIVGGLVGAERSYATGNLYGGAMITTNAHAFTGAGTALKGGPAGMKTRVRKWKEVSSQ